MSKLTELEEFQLHWIHWLQIQAEEVFQIFKKNCNYCTGLGCNHNYHHNLELPNTCNLEDCPFVRERTT